MRYVLMESNSKVSAQYTICISLFMHENRQYKLNALHPGIVFFFEKINKFRGFDKLKHISKKMKRSYSDYVKNYLEIVYKIQYMNHNNS